MWTFLIIVVIALVLLKGFDRLAGRSQTIAAKKMGAAVAPPRDIAEQIGHLAALRDSGALTEEEFMREKRKLIR